MRRTNKLPVEMKKVQKKGPKQETISFDDAVTLFLRESKVRNLSGYTQRHYKQELHKFKIKLKAQGMDVRTVRTYPHNEDKCCTELFCSALHDL